MVIAGPGGIRLCFKLNAVNCIIEFSQHEASFKILENNDVATCPQSRSIHVNQILELMKAPPKRRALIRRNFKNGS